MQLTTIDNFQSFCHVDCATAQSYTLNTVKYRFRWSLAIFCVLGSHGSRERMEYRQPKRTNVARDTTHTVTVNVHKSNENRRNEEEKPKIVCSSLKKREKETEDFLFRSPPALHFSFDGPVSKMLCALLCFAQTVYRGKTKTIFWATISMWYDRWNRRRTKTEKGSQWKRRKTNQ